MGEEAIPLTYASRGTRDPRRLKLVVWSAFAVLVTGTFVLGWWWKLHVPNYEPQIPLTQMRAELKADNIAAVTVHGDVLQIRTTRPINVGLPPRLVNEAFVVVPPNAADTWLVPWLMENAPSTAAVAVSRNRGSSTRAIMLVGAWAVVSALAGGVLALLLPGRRPASHVTEASTVSALATCLALAGCGYSTTGAPAAGDYKWRSLYRQDVRSVAVPIFNTKSFARGNEFQLTSALVKQLEASTPYKVMARERADTILEGEIVGTRISKVSENLYSAVPQEQLVIFTVNFTWKDLRTGQILVERRGFEEAAPYYPTLGEGRYYGGQETAERLAVAIVQELQAEW